MKKACVAVLLGALCAPTWSSASDVSPRVYHTDFSRDESPISEGGNWINGKTDGLDWADVATMEGLAYGLQSGSGGYDDATALLAGSWGPDQSVTAKVYSVDQMAGKVYEEVEIRLRSTLAANWNSGYEINFRCLKGSGSYVQIVRWNGPLGSFTYLADQQQVPGISDGDTISATIVGNVITAYLNGQKVAEASDGSWKSGSPGMGFFLQGAREVNTDYGFTSFTASDGAGAPPAESSAPAEPSAGGTSAGGTSAGGTSAGGTSGPADAAGSAAP